MVLLSDMKYLLSITGANASDPGQLGTVTTQSGTQADWLEQVPEAWRDHMGIKLRRRRSGHSAPDRMQSRPGAVDGGQTIPLDQASITAVLQWVSDEDARKQVDKTWTDIHSLCLRTQLVRRLSASKATSQKVQCRLNVTVNSSAMTT